jgi:SpoVK/Ycf46/Vps4 family AAA+-type ATPase
MSDTQNQAQGAGTAAQQSAGQGAAQAAGTGAAQTASGAARPALVCPACQRENRAEAVYCRFCSERIPKPEIALAADLSGNNAAALAADYIGLEAIRKALATEKGRIRMLQNTAKAQEEKGLMVNPEARKAKIYVFRGNTGVGKTHVAGVWSRDLQNSACLEPDTIVSISAKGLKKDFGNEFDFLKYLKNTKPGAIIIDPATEDIDYLHEIILALSKLDRHCVAILTGLPEDIDEFLAKFPEDEQRARYFGFPDPANEDLALILEQQMRRSYQVDDAAAAMFDDFVIERRNDPRGSHKNGWLVVNDCIPLILNKQTARLSEMPEASNDDILKILAFDIPLVNKPRTINEILSELDAMTGLTDVKKMVREIANKIAMLKKIETLSGKKSKGEGNNIVITGNPGTGKTTIVRTLGALFKALKLLPSDKLIEVNGTGLKAGYVGQSKDNVNKVCDEAMGGILFVDEAYVLANEQGPVDSFADEAAVTLMARLENDRDKFVGVVAGYYDQMQFFLDKINPGMRRRFKHYIHIPDYTAEELCQIFDGMAKEKDYTLSAEAAISAHKAIEEMVAKKTKNFGNVGDIRVFFERTTSKLASRLSALSEEDQLYGIKTITEADIAWEKPEEHTVDEILAELDAMVGMKDVKQTVREIAEKVQYEQAEAKRLGKDYKGEGNNIILTGNPGTGKTTIVRTLGKLFQAAGLLPRADVVEVQANALKGSYLGQSKDRVMEKVGDAMGAVLFVDEAYTLADEHGPVDDFAKEAAETLMVPLENERTKFVCVAAGYPKEMDYFLDKINPGMRRRFKYTLNLPDYSADELIEIFERFNVKKEGFTLTPEAQERARDAIRAMVARKGEHFGNAGDIRIFFERTTSRLASRMTKLSEAEREAVGRRTIQADDIAAEKKETLDVGEVLAELNKMVGMADVKKAVRGIAEKLNIRQERETLEREEAAKAGIEYKANDAQKEGNNMVVTGNPGTGKTTIVRTMAKLFKAIGLLPTDKLIEVNANDLKGAYVGESKDKVNEYCRQAMGGVLFVDEAYVLCNEQGPVDSFAKEAAETLMTHMENERDRFVCVVAGYEKEMGLFLDKVNPGMRRRFKHYLSLPDYSAAELFEIFEKYNVNKSGLTLTPEAREAAKKAIDAMVRKKVDGFGNAGAIRIFFEEITGRQSVRLSELSAEERTLEKLNTIEAADIGDLEKIISVDDVLAELDAMVGMTEVKQAVRGIANKLTMQKKQEEQTGKPAAGEGNHMVIMGNPGTGKTTIVRTLSKLFKAIGLLPAEKVLEIQGNDLKGSYVGQSKDKVNEYVRQAMSGVLFIDEAYSLVNERGPIDQFASEAIDVLMAHLENERDRFVGIVAGYPAQMDTFIKKSNPGMERRFKHYITLPDYTAEELIEIFERFNVKKAGFTLTEGAQTKARKAIEEMVANKGPGFGNAGAVRAFFERITTKQANRVLALSEAEQNANLLVIAEEDI